MKFLLYLLPFYVIGAFAQPTRFQTIADSVCKKNGFDYISAPEYCGQALIRKNGGVAYYNIAGRRLNAELFEAGEDMRYGYAPVMKNGKWGIVDSNMQVLLDFRYSQAPYILENGIIFKENGKRGFYHFATKQLIAAEYENINPFYEKDDILCLAFIKDGKTEVKSGSDLSTHFSLLSGHILPRYESILVQYDSSVALIDFDGNILVPEGKYDKINIFTDKNYFIVEKKDKTGWIDAKGKELFPPIIDEYHSSFYSDDNDNMDKYFNVMQNDTTWEDVIKQGEGKYEVSKNGINGAVCERKDKKDKDFIINHRIGLLDMETFQLILPIQFQEIDYSNNYWIASKSENSYDIYSMDGKWIKNCACKEVKDIYNNQLLVQKNDKVGLIDFQDRVIIPFHYKSIHRSGNLYRCYDENDNIDIYQSNGKKLKLPSTKDIFMSYAGADFSVYNLTPDNPYHNVLDSTMYWVLDKKGRMLDWQLEIAFAFGDYLVYKSHGKWGIKDKNRKEVLPRPCKYIDDWSRTMVNIGLVLENDSMIVYDKNLKIIPKSPNPIENLALIPFEKDGGIGYKNKAGQEVIPPIYKEAYKRLAKDTHIFPLEQPELWGICDTNGKIVIHPTYHYITEHDKGYLWLKRGDKTFFRGKENDSLYEIKSRVVVFMKAYQLYPTNNLVIAQQNGKLGVLNPLGKMIIPFIYEDILALDSSLFLVAKDKKIGVVDIHNQVILPLAYHQTLWDEDYQRSIQKSTCLFLWEVDSTNSAVYNIKLRKFVTPFAYQALKFAGGNDNLAVKQANKWGLISPEGELLVPCKFPYFIYEPARCTGIGYYSFSFNKEMITYSYKDFSALYRKGKEILPYQKQDIWLYDNGICKQEKNGTNTLYTPSGKKIPFHFSDDINLESLEEGNAYLLIEKKDNLCGVIDTNGVEKIPANYKKIAFYDNTYFLTTVEKKIGAMDSAFHWIRKTEWDDISQIDATTYLLTQNGKMGVWKTNGTWLFPLEYDGITEKQKGVYIVSKNKKCALADSTGHLLTPFIYEGMAFLDNELGISIKDDCLFGLMDYKGKVLFAPQFDMITVSGNSDSMITIMQNNLYGIINKEGKKTIPCELDKLERMYLIEVGSYYKIIKKDLSGVIDQNGNVILAPIYKEIKPKVNFFVVQDTSKQVAATDYKGNILVPFGLFDGIGSRDTHTWGVHKNGTSFRVDKQFRFFSRKE